MAGGLRQGIVGEGVAGGVQSREFRVGSLELGIRH